MRSYRSDDTVDESCLADLDELTLQEQEALGVLVDGAQDRPATWGQNILCFHYGRCVAPWTGGGGSEPKNLPQPLEEVLAEPELMLSLQPNPSSPWTVAKVLLVREDATALLRVLDAMGKEVALYRVAGRENQIVLDTRKLSPGVYMVEVQGEHIRLASEQLIIQP